MIDGTLTEEPRRELSPKDGPMYVISVKIGKDAETGLGKDIENIEIEAWGTEKRNCAESLHKGSRIQVVGCLAHVKRYDKNGKEEERGALRLRAEFIDEKSPSAQIHSLQNSVILGGKVIGQRTEKDEKGKNLCILSIESLRPFRNEFGNEAGIETIKNDFRVITRGMLAEKCAQMKIGQEIRTIGSLKQLWRDDPGGGKHAEYMIVADHVEYSGKDYYMKKAAGINQESEPLETKGKKKSLQKQLDLDIGY
jgi:single-stranded DNA-binding protein